MAGATRLSPPETLGSFESDDKVRQSIEWFARRQNRLMAWIGRQIQSLHHHYVRLEQKIDPGERWVKAIWLRRKSVSGCAREGSRRDSYRTLRRQWWKHVFWFSIDMVVTGVVIIFTPFLAPIPGPNVFLYYPFLRLLSHYRAIRGASSGLHSADLEFKDLPEAQAI